MRISWQHILRKAESRLCRIKNYSAKAGQDFPQFFTPHIPKKPWSLATNIHLGCGEAMQEYRYSGSDSSLGPLHVKLTNKPLSFPNL